MGAEKWDWNGFDLSSPAIPLLGRSSVQPFVQYVIANNLTLHPPPCEAPVSIRVHSRSFAVETVFFASAGFLRPKMFDVAFSGKDSRML